MMSALPPLSGYSIWLLPEQEAYDFFQDIIQVLAESYDSVRFLPHCTLHSFPGVTEPEDLLNSVERLSSGIEKLSIPVKDIRSDNQNYQSLYVQLKYTDELKKIKEECFANRDLKAVENYQPHISLYYGNMQLPEKRELRTKFKSVLPDQVTFNRLAIIKLDEQVENWQRLREFDFKNF